MKGIRHVFDERKKTRQDLIRLYVTVIKEKFLYQYNPKKMILDILPFKKDLFSVFLTNRNYSLSQSIQDNGRLEFQEHRFINFLKFTEFSDEEIKKVFDAHGALCKEQVVPEKYQYTARELHDTIRSLTNRNAFNMTDEDLNDAPVRTANGEIKMPLLSREEMEKLYSKE